MAVEWCPAGARCGGRIFIARDDNVCHTHGEPTSSDCTSGRTNTSSSGGSTASRRTASRVTCYWCVTVGQEVHLQSGSRDCCGHRAH